MLNILQKYQCFSLNLLQIGSDCRQEQSALRVPNSTHQSSREALCVSYISTLKRTERSQSTAGGMDISVCDTAKKLTVSYFILWKEDFLLIYLLTNQPHTLLSFQLYWKAVHQYWWGVSYRYWSSLLCSMLSGGMSKYGVKKWLTNLFTIHKWYYVSLYTCFIQMFGINTINCITLL